MVALKEPRAGCRDCPATLRHFADEARVTAGLDHPGIVCLHEFHSGGATRPCYVMRLVTGRTLAERIRDLHQPPFDRTPSETRLLRHELLRALVCVAEAVAFAHSRGVIHCDLKPGNVIVGDFGEAVILDWGMARQLGRHDPDARGAVGGTPDYMAPEQADGTPDARSDVFGLGGILYELLTARSPQGWQEGARPSDWREKVRAARFERPRDIDPDASKVLEAVCLRSLHRDPAQRYQTGAEFALEVKRFLAGEPVVAWKESLPIRILRTLRARA
jgi:serine/threonine protein kinase